MIVRSTCPRDCYDRCGLTIHVEGGVIQKIVGDPAHPHTKGDLCAKCATAYNGIWLDDRARLRTPLLRCGPKGSGAYTPIEWPEALERIASQVRSTTDILGAGAILHAHYQGTYSAIACNFPNRLFHCLGATEVEPSTICDKAGHVALQAMFGTSFSGFDPRTRDDADTLLLWGVNPSHSGPMTDRHCVSSFRGTRIVVDPLKTETALRADLHLQPFPGTDVELAYAMLAVMASEDLLDQAFLDAHTQGWAAVAAHLRTVDLAQASARTGVEASLIAEAARCYARGPSLLWLGIGLQRQAQGGDAVRAVALLPAATGQLGKPGTGFLYMNGYETVGVPVDRLTMPELCPATPRSVSHMDLAQVLEDPQRAGVFFNWNTNVLASAPQQQRLRRALEREDLYTVVIDLFMTDTAQVADIILPAASFLEFDDLVFSYFQQTVSAQVKVREPAGSALPNQEIFRRLALALGLDEPALQEEDDQIICALLEKVAPGLTFAELARAGTVFAREQMRLQFADLRFATPSGKIEIDGAAFARAGLDPIPRAGGTPRPAPGLLRLLSPSHPLLMNSTYGNDPRIRKRLGEASVVLNPADAVQRQLRVGDLVDVRSSAGALRLRVQIADLAPAGVAVCYKSRWPGQDGGGNVNRLSPALRADLGDSTAVNSVEVTITAVAEPAAHVSA